MEIKRNVDHLGGTNGLRDLLTNNYPYSTPFETMWFCSRDTAQGTALGMLKGNGMQAFYSIDPQCASSGQAVLSYIEQLGFKRKIVNWWQIAPRTDNFIYQELLEKIHLAGTDVLELFTEPTQEIFDP